MPKSCTVCHTRRPVLVRCQIDRTAKWHFVCPGRCWTSVSGGVEDARGLEEMFPEYRYGGMWKDRGEGGPVSAKTPRKVKERRRREERARGGVVEGTGGCGGGSGDGEAESVGNGVSA